MNPFRIFLILAVTSVLVATANAEQPHAIALQSSRWFGQARYHANVPAKLKQLVLEVRQGSGWRPVRVWHLTASTKLPKRRVAITLPAGVARRNLRLVAYENTKFPSRFTRGKTAFKARPLSQAPGEIIADGVAGSRLLQGAQAVAVVSATAGRAQTDAAAAAVTEPDIWQMAGETLFFFNQFRGLQVFDMSDPALPRRTGALRLPASGEQLFVLDETGSAVALLGRSNRRETAGEAAVFLVAIRDGVPSLMAELPLGGHVVDSRLVGSHLHVLTQSWHLQSSVPVGDEAGVFTMSLIRHSWATWAPEARLHTLDLRAPETPVVHPPVRLPGQASCLQAAEGHLLVGGVAAGTWTPQLQVLAVQPEAGPILRKTFATAGHLQDKFKMARVGDAIACVSVSWQNGRSETWVETFPLDGASLQPLARLELEGARDESLHATRFDGSRLYVVTFRQVDPLFVVNLEDPAMPSLQGVLEIPGWSTYLEPLGDRLIAVGVEAGLVTASLFDVGDAHAPSLLSRVSLGEAGKPSWSEANYDEKAVFFDQEQNVLMVPFEQWDNAGMSSAVQVLAVDRQELSPLQVLPHPNRARRGRLVGSHYVTVSGQELLATPRAGGDAARVTLAWRVDRVLEHQGFLIQVDDGPQSNSRMGPFLMGVAPAARAMRTQVVVSRTDEPDQPLVELEIEDAPVVGLERMGSRICLAQWLAAGEEGILRTWVLDLGQLPDLIPVATLDQPVKATAWNLDLENARALFPRSDLLVWHLPAQAFDDRWWWQRITFPVITGEVRLQTFTPVVALPVNSGNVPAARLGISPPLLWRPGNASCFCPVLLGDQPSALPPLMLPVAKNLQSVGRTFAGGGFIFTSHDETSTSEIPSLPAVAGLQSLLHVLDCRSSEVLVRPPVNLPGRLVGMDRADAQGAILMTEVEGGGGTKGRCIQACAYDGLSVWQLDELALDLPAWTPTAAAASRLFLVRHPEQPGVAEVVYDATTGRLSQGLGWELLEAPHSLHVVGDLLLAPAHGSLAVANLTADGLRPHPGDYETPVNLNPRLDRARPDAGGLWLPVREYGVEYLSWTGLLTEAAR